MKGSEMWFLRSKTAYQRVDVLQWLEGKAVVIGLDEMSDGVATDKPSLARFSELERRDDIASRVEPINCDHTGPYCTRRSA